jgi:hypothetical protein
MHQSFSRISICLISLCIAANGVAQNNRTAVSVAGSDANACTTTSPCRSFGAALAVTNAGGEVIAFDSGGYGAFTVSKAVSVIGAPGAHVALTVSSGNGIDVNAGSGDSVSIRNLAITVNGGTSYGIYALSFGALSIVNCTVKAGQNGIVIGGGAGSYATVVDTDVSLASNLGYFIYSPAALVRCRAEKNLGALSVRDGTAADGIVSTVDFIAVSNTFSAALSTFVAGHTTALTLDHALVSSNSGGISAYSIAGGSATARVTNSTVTDNGGFGFNQSTNATFLSMGNNLVDGNASGPTSGAITLATAH